METGGNQPEYEAISFNPSPQSSQDELQQEPEAVDGQAKLLRWHYTLGHLPFCYIQLLTHIGEISKHLAKVKPPRCVAYLFGAMTRVPKQTSKPIFKVTKPGQCVSVDQMISTQVSFVAQLKGTLTRRQ